MQSVILNELSRLAAADDQRREAEAAKERAAVQAALAAEEADAPEPPGHSAPGRLLSPTHEAALRSLVDGLRELADKRSVVELADASGVSKSLVYSLLSGQESNPRLNNLAALCSAWNLTLTINGNI